MAKAGIKKTVHILLLIIMDSILIFAASYGALFSRLEFQVSDQFIGFATELLWLMPYSVVFGIVFLFLFGIYRTDWRYSGSGEILMGVGACFSMTLAQIGLIILMDASLPRSLPLLFFAFSVLLIVMTRVVYGVIYRKITSGKGEKKRTMIVGAGRCGVMLLKELSESPQSKNKVVCLVDSDRTKWGTTILGVPILGSDDRIPQIAQRMRVEEIIIAIPSISEEDRHRLLDIAGRAGLPIKSTPSLTQLVNGESFAGQLEQIQIEDLLERKPVIPDTERIKSYISGRRVLVTGGGGSIGSELCRQIAELGPECLIIFDIYENSVYELDYELRANFPDLNLKTLIGSVRDPDRLRAVFAEHRPELVFHAAAHKHVPLMENSPGEAIKNNVFGTYNVAAVCAEYGVKRMLLVSTDKAVNPTNVMGASKRICEMVVQMMNRHVTGTEYVAVRFGNVLGSNGSVIPLFRKQIADGGPVTVTHPDIIRYFMTIPEAVSLILATGLLAHGGEIFVLDMGKPVRIDDLARRMIRLAGHVPDGDIKIKYTGLRPGEKLYEEMLLAEEGLEKTDNDMIYIGKPIPFDDSELERGLKRLKEAADCDDAAICGIVAELVPTFDHKENKRERVNERQR